MFWLWGWATSVIKVDSFFGIPCLASFFWSSLGRPLTHLPLSLTVLSFQMKMIASNFAKKNIQPLLPTNYSCIASNTKPRSHSFVQKCNCERWVQDQSFRDHKLSPEVTLSITLISCGRGLDLQTLLQKILTNLSQLEQHNSR